MKLLWYETKNCFNKNSILVMCLMVLVGILHCLIYLNLQYRTVTSDGKLVEGLPAFRVYYEISKDLDGVLDDTYLKKITKEYNESYEKYFLANVDKGFLDTGGMMKYIKTNYLLNFPRLGVNFTNGNENMDLSYDFLKTADDYYKAYKKTLYESYLTFREWSGLKPFTEKEKQILKSKIEKLKTPFVIEDTWSLNNTDAYLHIEFSIMLFMVCIALSSLFAKDGINKISDMALSSKKGRSSYITARFFAGLIFTFVFAVIQFFAVYLVQGIIQGFDGFGASAQVGSSFCIWDISFGAVFIFRKIGFICGLLVVAGITMAVSIIVKRVKISIAVSSALTYFIMKISGGYDAWNFINPIRFNSYDVMTDVYFIFEVLVPYIVIILILTFIYLTICYLSVFFIGKKYRL
ncbi:MAG: hypothetical protein ACTTHM_03405 [Peptoanaerobacter stomatis]|uniref:hypothetical protein n=1 Tax=Peptoanaerobacter stomatis TaxID=796937 RepID=UPI003FA16FE9